MHHKLKFCVKINNIIDNPTIIVLLFIVVFRIYSGVLKNLRIEK